MLATIRHSSIIKRDPYLQLERVVTADGRSLLMKLVVSDYQSEEEEALLHREYQLFEDLATDWALEPRGLMKLGNRAACCYSDLAGEPLSAAWKREAQGLESFLATVFELCTILEALHQRKLMLLGITTDAFLCGHSPRRLVLVDAPFAHPIGAPFGRGHDLFWTQPYLRYAAPEVLSRSSRKVDERADLYSLGVILYELLSGRVPFACDDPAELIQCHLARDPPRLTGSAGFAVPDQVVTAVMTLLSKEPASRPAGIRAFAREFVAVASRAPANGGSAEALGSDEVEHRFRPSPKLYGRDETFRRLRARMSAVRSSPSIAFIEGEAGMGKTALLRLLRDTRLDRGAHFGSGRFHQSAPTPLSGWVTALGDVAATILTKDRAELERWRSDLMFSLGEWAPLISVLVPQWQAVLRCSSPSQSENPDASINRLALAIHRLLGAFANVDNPVVLLFDDLQWADASSLRILELVLTAPEPVNLLVLGSTRSNDGNGSDGTMRALRDRLAAANVEVEVCVLPPLGAEHIRALIEDSCEGLVQDVAGLSDLVLARTAGSPLFIREFIAVLVRKKVLRRGEGEDGWRWSTNEIQALPVADDVVTLVANKIGDLPREVQETLRLSSCLGMEFSLRDFCAVYAVKPDRAATYLERATALGLLRSRPIDVTARGNAPANPAAAEVTADVAYEFVHDRVLDACGVLNSDAERASLHLHIGRVLAGRLANDSDPTPEMYRIARHFNAARSLVTSDGEVLRCAQWNLQAGSMAKARGAFSQALDYHLSGLDFLGCRSAAPEDRRPSAWTRQFELTLALHLGAAEAALPAGQLALMYELCDVMLTRISAPLQKVPIYELRITGLKAQARFPQALQAALEILAELGLHFPAAAATHHVLVGFLLTKHKLLSTGIVNLHALPTLTDANRMAVGRIIHAVYPAAYLGNPNLFPLLVYRHVRDSIAHGNSELSAVTYAGFAAVLCAMGEVDRALQLGDVALQLLAAFDASRLRARVFAVYYFLLFPWKNHLHECAPGFVAGIESGLEHGDIEFSCYMMNMHSLARFYSGSRLSSLREEFGRHHDKIASLGHARSYDMQCLLCQLVSDLTADHPVSPLDGPHYKQEIMLPRCMDPLDENLVFHNHLTRLVLGVLFQDAQSTIEAADHGRAHLQRAAFGSYIGVVFIFYESLGYLGVPATARKRSHLRQVARNQRTLKAAARSAPMNFLHKYHLVEAERCRLAGRAEQAIEHYERAIDLAQEHGYLHEMALALERAAGFYFDRGMARLGRHYLREAFHAYDLWGAEAKKRHIEQSYPHLIATLDSRKRLFGPTGSGRFSEALDHRVVLKASQAISGEILLPQLLDKLLRTILEHAGAQRGVLLLESKGELYLELECDVDGSGVSTRDREHLEETTRVAHGIVHYAARMEQPIVLGDAALEGLFTGDPYVVRRQPRSVLCTPILHQGRLVGLVYLENNRMSHVFTSDRLEVIQLLAGQAAISIANARFHALQLEAQQSKINPHFLFNALSSIADLTVSDGKTAEHAIVSLANLYRYILTSSDGTLVSLDEELHVVRQYLSLEQLRFGAKLSFRVTSVGETSQVMLPGLLIQPLAENAVRHGIAPKLGHGTVVVHAHVDGTTCCITVQDDGDGTKHTSGGMGFGLRSVQERLTLVYGTRYSFAISRSDGYRVEIEIPAQIELDAAASVRSASATPVARLPAASVDGPR